MRTEGGGFGQGQGATGKGQGTRAHGKATICKGQCQSSSDRGNDQIWKGQRKLPRVGCKGILARERGSDHGPGVLGLAMGKVYVTRGEGEAAPAR